MADNYLIPTPGGDRTFAADDIGGVLYDRAKIAFGADGAASDVADGNPLPVKLASQSYLPGVGLSTFKRVSTGDTNAASVVAGAKKLYGWMVSNVNAAVRYLKLYDLAVAPTVGTSVPKLTVLLPAGSLTALSIPNGITFTAGIAMALTTEATDAGSTGVSASEHVVNLFYGD